MSCSPRPDRRPISSPLTTGRRAPRGRCLLACAAALSFGASLYATSKASADLPVPWVLLPARLIGVAALAVPLALRGTLALTRPAVPLVLAAGVCEVLGFASFAAGSRHGVAVAAVLASQFAALAAVAAFVLFRERLTRLRALGGLHPGARRRNAGRDPRVTDPARAGTTPDGPSTTSW